MLALEPLKRQNVQRLKHIEAQIKAIGHAILERIEVCEPLKQCFDILISIRGIATISACALLIEMPDLGMLDEKQPLLWRVSHPSPVNPKPG